MRFLVIIVLVAGCHHPKPLEDDLATFCSPEAQHHVGPINEFGPWYEPRVKSPEMKDELAKIKDGRVSVPEWQQVLAAQLAQAKIASCPTYDALFKPTPGSDAPGSDAPAP